MVDSYEVMWQRDTSGDCSDVDEGSMSITDGSTSYVITGLEEDSSYSIAVEAMNSIGMATSNTATGVTQEAGKQLIGICQCSTRLYKILSHTYLPSVPTTAPTNVGTSSGTFSSITVQWEAVNCIHRNGDITGYAVRYGVQGSGTQTVSVSGGEATMTTISGLTASTQYSIEVAAVNSAGTGVYSNVIMQLTQGIISYYTCIILNDLHLNHSFQSFSPVEAPVLSVVGSTAATTISLSWTSAGSVVDSYEVMWQRDTSGDCPDEDEGSMSITDGSTSYMITGLEEESSYSIAVEAINSIGMATSNTATGMTQEAGMSVCKT